MYGDSMIERQCCVEMKVHGLKAIEHLSQLLNACQGRCSLEEYEQIKTSVGRAMGIIMIELLDDVVYAAYPELDDLE